MLSTLQQGFKANSSVRRKDILTNKNWAVSVMLTNKDIDQPNL